MNTLTFGRLFVKELRSLSRSEWRRISEIEKDIEAGEGIWFLVDDTPFRLQVSDLDAEQGTSLARLMARAHLLLESPFDPASGLVDTLHEFVALAVSLSALPASVAEFYRIDDSAYTKGAQR
jgi:hypothetical protein